MDSRTKFQKGYARDFTLILEQVWVQSFAKSEERLNFKNEHRPYVFLHATDRDLQIWEHQAAIDAFQDVLLEKNESDRSFMPRIISEYQSAIAELNKFREVGRISQEDIPTYVRILGEAMNLFNLWYYAGLDERTPQEIRKISIDLREHDYLFSEQDLLIKQTLGSAGVPRAYANLVLLQEFEHPPEISVLVKRSSGVAVMDGEGYEIIPLQEFANAHAEIIFEDISTDTATREVSGQIGYKGFVRGHAKVVRNHGDIEKVEQGDVLVTPMTVPDFLPAMKNASAFVTDEGGVMCHAAIIAREMKRPCVIGTKFATQVFKDGDMVEVDAEKGIVRKI